MKTFFAFLWHLVLSIKVFLIIVTVVCLACSVTWFIGVYFWIAVTVLIGAVASYTWVELELERFNKKRQKGGEK